MTFSLNTIILEPLSKEKPKNAVILCHGYGGDGKDISILASYWRAHLPDTIIICPDAPEKCAASPTGFQWFDLMDQTPEQILSKSLIAENKLNKLIDEVKARLSGLLDPIVKEEIVGTAEVLEVFNSPKFGQIAGCIVIEGNGRFSGYTMPAKKVQVNILGKGHCEVNAIEKLHVEIKGQANVYAKGMPSLYKRITGQGDVYFTD